ncbi:hypothetical protein HGP14_06260 [Rhizobium sp. P32RR-XVIII]|uniref:hypothetical protein n=1 Tax=Rhizobium sp. P32RR-XVIII TaxID=2726738 RepID=UPI0014572830|nr:hypothetical protein [Rhizobium sp. P32RR-XVIII]NLS02974.1 hypothetical protein [Rhizobium sp. P32RR-XVIII]
MTMVKHPPPARLCYLAGGSMKARKKNKKCLRGGIRPDLKDARSDNFGFFATMVSA